MSYRALLFCPDEAAARLVTQVLSELDFTVELSFEPFVTVKKLSEENFDAIVVDSADEQNASVLFKGARGSDLNHSSLCVAVAEGQAGVAKAFRIGANLVLTKPINIEQSKNTLRVAKGLLRKNTQSPSAGQAPSGTSTSPHTPMQPIAHTPASQPASVAPSASVPAPSMPSSLLEAEQARPHAHAAPTPASNSSVTRSSVPGLSGYAAAAPALAPDRRDSAAAPEAHPVHQIKSAPPLATHDAIFPTTNFTPKPEPPAPSFSSYSHARPARKGSSKMVWIVPCLLILGAAGYFGWRKFQPMRYVHFGAPAVATAPAPAPVESTDSDVKPSPDVDNTSAKPNNDSQTLSSTPSVTASSSAPTSSISSSAPEGFPTKEHIEIGAPAETHAEPVTAVAKPQPIQVNQTDTHVADEPPAAPAPPALVLGANNSDSTLAGIVATHAMVPRAVPGTLKISQGITQGLLIKRVPPNYPSSALQLRREGTVELLATISKTGAITKVKVLSGDAMLAAAAADAVRRWKYRPYLLDGEPVEIETQISIIFKLPH